MSRKTPVNTLIPSIGSGPHGSQVKGSSAPLAKIDIFAGEALTSAHSDWSHPWRGAPGIDRHAFRVNPAHGRAPRHHDTPVSAGTPSIAGISDVVKEPGVFPSQTAIRNSLPTIIGFGHAGDVVTVFDGDHSIGSALVQADGTWHFSTPPLAKGTHEFFVTVVSPVSGITLVSNHLVVHMIGDTVPPAQNTATITCALDEFIDPNGVHHDNVILNGGNTADTSPKLSGSLSGLLHAGDVLAVYRDGQEIGNASVTGLAWSYQDNGLPAGKHTYSVGVVSASGVQETRSADFSVVETAGTSFGTFPMLATEDFLIFDTRLISRTTADGTAISFDLLESVKILDKAGMTVKSYNDKDGFISIEVDWMTYAKSHPGTWVDFVSHRHVDNDHGGLNYYNTVGFPPLSDLLNQLGVWRTAGFASDGAEFQSPRPAAAATITGVYDSYIDEAGATHQLPVPEGGATAAASHRIEGTLSEPIQFFSDWLVIYRDGVKLEGSNHSTNFPNSYSNTTWWIIDTDVPPGPHVYTARVERTYGEQGQWSESYGFVETDAAPLAITTVATITGALDEFIDPNGVHHDNVILNGGTTLDTSPKLTGTIDVALHDGEMLAVYRDGVKVGHANVSGLGWSFQDGGLVAGDHLYTARVESAAGMPGNLSATFAVAEKALKSFAGIPVLATEDFLIFDTRAISRITSDGAPVAFDLMESVKALEKLGMTVQRYAEQGGFISLEVDWMDYAKSHPRDDVEFVSHRHVDNGKGGLDYYDTVGVPAFAYLTNKLGTWVQTGLPSDGAALQSPLPAPATSITDIYDASGDPGQARIPDGGSTSSSTFKVVGTFSEPVNSGDVLAVYRDGVRMTSTSLEGGYDRATNTWWLIDKEVPPGPHTYTARVQRMYGDQGEWSDSYSLVETILDTPRDTLAARILMNDGTLSVDVRSVAQSYTDESGTSIVLRAQLTLPDKSVIVIPPALSDDGVVAFQADWARLVATHPDAKLTITMDDGTGNAGQVVDAHLLRSLATQMNHWITATPNGESTAFFDVSDRSIQIHGGSLIKTLAVSDDHQTIDLSSLTGKTVAATIMGIEKIDLGGQHNTLQIALIDVLNLGEKDLFRSDGKQQLMINGKAGDLVELANTRVAGISDGAWEQPVQTKIGGVTYDVYEHSTAHVELMVQSGVQLVQH